MSPRGRPNRAARRKSLGTAHPAVSSSSLIGRSAGKAVNITIPIEEGPQFRMGALKIVSADPDKALSDGANALRLDLLGPLWRKLRKLHLAFNERE